MGGLLETAHRMCLVRCLENSRCSANISIFSTTIIFPFFDLCPLLKHFARTGGMQNTPVKYLKLLPFRIRRQRSVARLCLCLTNKLMEWQLLVQNTILVERIRLNPAKIYCDLECVCACVCLCVCVCVLSKAAIIIHLQLINWVL